MDKIFDGLEETSTGAVTLLIPPGTDISKLSARIISEIATARNIKNKKNQNCVLSSLSKISDRLKTMRAIPDNGIAIYAGSRF